MLTGTPKLPSPNLELQQLEEAFDGDIDLLLFYVSWLKNGLSAKKAYKELHPDVTDASSEVLGSRMLSKVKQTDIVSAYGLSIETYFQQLKEALAATKRDHFSGEISPDHKTREPYHTKLGKMLGLEKDGPQVVAPTQNNFFLNDEQVGRIIDE